MTNNILDIYERLYSLSDNITGETIDYIRGVQDAVYLLKIALQKHEHLNLHLENRRLTNHLKKVEADLNTYIDDKNVVFKRNKELQKKVLDLSSELTGLKRKKEAEIQKCVMGERLRDVEIDFETTPIKFSINADKETFDFHFQDAVKYVYEKRDRKTKRVGETIIRKKGFKLMTS
jgi:hypothetical protein